jgi:hypothetical protein
MVERQDTQDALIGTKLGEGGLDNIQNRGDVLMCRLVNIVRRVGIRRDIRITDLHTLWFPGRTGAVA